MQLKGIRPGRFRPRCSACGGKFLLIIPDDPNAAPEVAAEGAVSGETLTPAISFALGIESSPARPAPIRTPASVATTTVPPPPAQTTLPPPDAPVGVSAAPEDLPTQPSPTAPKQPATDEMPETYRRLGGYELVRKLGQGGMGSVFLARQLSLGRNVAVKVLLGHFASDPQFIARFIREAYAAAQLTHHNIVQIHDIGQQKRTHFFSMELVEGQTLASLVAEQGPIDPEETVNYVLQAARGLKFAHDHGMIHRDVKPENLMLNRQGLVKVADLGLVKTAGAKRPEGSGAAPSGSDRWRDVDMTQLNTSMGTPAYMPPEQAADAHNVDLRADVYALGCTMYTLLVGHPPFVGQTAVEVITKHLREPVTPPDRAAGNVPVYLSRIVVKMLAKRPEDRYRDMGEVIAAMEEFLGDQTKGPFIPSEAQVQSLQSIVQRFNASSAARARAKLARLFLPLSAVLFIAVFFLPVSASLKFQTLAGVLGFAGLTPLAYLTIQGLRDRTYLFQRVREYVLGGGIAMLFLLLGGLTLSGGMLVAIGVHWAWMIALLAAILLAWIFHFIFDSAVADQRIDTLGMAEVMLKKIRRSGVGEPAVQQFVCRHAGEQWEELYEALFGYESKIQARELWGRIEPLERMGKGDRGRPRPMFAAWRDPIVQWIDARRQSRREARDRRHIELLERENYRAKGFPEPAARKKAREIATTIVVKAADLHESALAKYMIVVDSTKAVPDQPKQDDEDKGGDGDKPRRAKRPVLDDEGLEGYEHLSYFQRRYGGWAGFFLGPAVRLIVGMILMAVCVLWARQNELLPTQVPISIAGTNESATAVAARPKERQTESLRIGSGSQMSIGLLSGWQVGIAGLLLVVSALVKSPGIGLYLFPAAAVMLAGAHLPTPVRQVPSWCLATAAGLVIAVIGFRLARE